MPETCTATTAKGTRCTNSPKTEGKCGRHVDTAQLGRKSDLTPELQDSIIQAIRDGNYISVAVKRTGIGESTFYSWRERGEADIEAERETQHALFVEALQKAEADAEHDLLSKAANAPAGQWQKYMTILERRWRERWSQGVKLDHSGSVERVVRPDLSSLSTDERERLAELLEKT